MATQALHRRRFLQGLGVAVTLPILEATSPRIAFGAEPAAPCRLVAICTSLGLHSPAFFPTEAGKKYAATDYLKTIDKFRNDYTVFSGLSHPDQSGANGHSSETTWLTSARNPGLGGFRNTISVDQVIAEKIGFQTRFPSLALGTAGASQSYTRSGVMIPAESSPSRLFAKLFLNGSPKEIAEQMRNVRDGRSILDTVSAEAKRLGRRSSAGDREKLGEYFQSVRETEQRLVLAEEWAKQPKPTVDADQPEDNRNESDLIGRTRLMMGMIPLALQTDSTRAITLLIQGRNDVPPVPGVSIDHHNLSHHGKDEEKIAQLRRIETAQMLAFAELLAAMKSKKEGGASLLDSTMTVFGSNLGNANSHDTRNLPILLAGGKFRHGQHVRRNAEDNTPLSNLFVTLLQHVGVETDSFGTSSAEGVTGFV